jgi:hypothetical protein
MFIAGGHISVKSEVKATKIESKDSTGFRDTSPNLIASSPRGTYITRILPRSATTQCLMLMRFLTQWFSLRGGDQVGLCNVSSKRAPPYVWYQQYDHNLHFSPERLDVICLQIRWRGTGPDGPGEPYVWYTAYNRAPSSEDLDIELILKFMSISITRFW